MKPEEQLTEAAKKLHHAAGVQWNEFLTALKAVEVDAALALVRTSPDKLPLAQGRAQFIRDLTATLSKA
jgi:hypothetical protein